ncbi:MAG: hypothetical protein M3R16_00955 [Pseudomonadota bacterium]|nr:hypothetical protein [Pseudomonadota bacterium]
MLVQDEFGKRDFDGEMGAIGMQPHCLGCAPVRAFGPGIDVTLQATDMAFPQMLRLQRRQGTADQLLGRMPEDPLRTGIGIKENAGLVEDDHRIRRRFPQHPIEVFGLAKRFVALSTLTGSQAHLVFKPFIGLRKHLMRLFEPAQAAAPFQDGHDLVR